MTFTRRVSPPKHDVGSGKSCSEVDVANTYGPGDFVIRSIAPLNASVPRTWAHGGHTGTTLDAIPFDVKEESAYEVENSGRSQPQRRRQQERQSKLEEEVQCLRDAVAQQPQMELTIKQLRKQLEVARDTAAMATARDVRPGSHYRLEIAGLKKSLVEKDEIIAEQELAIAKLMNHFKRQSSSPLPSSSSSTADTSQNTSVCSSFIEDDKSNGSCESPPRDEGAALKNQIRNLQAENERVRNHLTGELEDLRKRLAVSSRQLHAARQQEQTSQRELRLLEEQVMSLKGGLPVFRGRNEASASKSCAANDLEDDEFANSVPFDVAQSQLKHPPMVDLEQELVNVKKALVVSEGEIKKLQNSLWIAKLQNESTIELAEELDLERAARKKAEHKLAETQAVIQRQEKDDWEKNRTMPHVDGEFQRLEHNKESDDTDGRVAQMISFSPTDEVEGNLVESLQNAKHELRTLRLSFSAKEQHLLANSKTALEKLQLASDELIAMKQESIKRDSEISDLKIQLDQKSGSLMDARESVRELKEIISKLEDSAQQPSNEARDLLTDAASLENTTERFENSHERESRYVSEAATREDPKQKSYDALVHENQALSKKVQLLSCEIAELEQKLASSKDGDAAKRLEEVQIEHARSLASISMNSQVTINTLRKDLAIAREKCAEEVAKMTASLSTIQDENDRLKRLCESTALKDQQIFALEQTLYAQENMVESLKTELSQLRSNFSRAASDRRSELEQMRSDFVEQATLVKEKDRKLQSLSIEIEKVRAQHVNEVRGLNDRIKTLEMESPLSRTMRTLQQANIVIEVKERLESLKVTNTKLKEENIKLSRRLERAEITLRSIEAHDGTSEQLEQVGSDSENDSVERKIKRSDCKNKFIDGDNGDNIPSILYIDSSTQSIDEDL